METISAYLLKSALWLVAFYLVYRFFLRNETFHGFNRFFLLTGLLASVGMPFVTIYRTIVVPAEPAITMANVAAVAPAAAPETVVDWQAVVLQGALILYAVVFVLLTCKTAVSLFPILSEIVKNRKQHHLIVTRIPQAPFSFGRYIFIPESIHSDNEKELIIRHEKIHTRELHFIDLWLSKLICIVQFFNPVAWLYARAVQENCEFIADRKTISSTPNHQEYIHLLVKYSIGKRYNPATLHFAFPFILKRINRMKQQPSNRLAILKCLLILPLAVSIIGMSAQTKVQTPKAPKAPKVAAAPVPPPPPPPPPASTGVTTPAPPALQRDTLAQKGNELPTIQVTGYGDGQTTASRGNNQQEVFTVVESMPSYPGGGEALRRFFASNIRYPADAQRRAVQGRVICQFIVEPDGSITEVRVARGVDPLLDAEACRMLYTMPKWNPGKQNGIAVRVKYTVPIEFKLN
jgi:TonB family protein